MIIICFLIAFANGKELCLDFCGRNDKLEVVLFFTKNVNERITSGTLYFVALWDVFWDYVLSTFRVKSSFSNYSRRCGID